MELERPKGWTDVDLSNAGGPSEFEAGEGLEDERDAERGLSAKEKDRLQKLRETGRGSTLRCFLVQIKILENHQNGKDTHLRGLQIFAKDEGASREWRRSGRNAATALAGDLGIANGVAEVANAGGGPRAFSPVARTSAAGARRRVSGVAAPARGQARGRTAKRRSRASAEDRELREALRRAEAVLVNADVQTSAGGLRESEWMREPEIR